MSILKELTETATGGSTSAGAVAGFRATLFGGDMGGKKEKKGKKSGMIRRDPVGSVYGFKFVGEGFSFTNYLIEAEDSDFDTSDVIAKLKSASKEAEAKGDDTVAFALEDEDGAMVKVWVPQDQADEFQDSLEMALSKNDDDDDEQNTPVEIAEVLWKLRKDFDITNVEWAEIPEDQEETLPTDVDVAGEPGAEGEAGAEGGLEGEGDAEGGLEGEGDDMTADPGEAGELGDTGEEDVRSALSSVIDMMKADAEARKAEADARAKEAEAKQAELNAQAASSKVKQEEEILDMETYYDDKKEQDGESKRLADLAKYRHDMAGENGSSINGDPSVEKEVSMSGPGGMEMEKEVSMGGGQEMGAENEEWVKRRWQAGSHDTMLSRSELGDLVLRALRRR